MPALEIDDQYMTMNDLACYCRISISTVKRMMKDPSRPMPRVKIGGRVLVRRSDFDAWVDKYCRSKPVQTDADAREWVHQLAKG